MPGRNTFFSFHYERDIWRASTVRNSSKVVASSSAGFTDRSLWEAVKRQGDDAIKRAINDGLKGTSVTVVLIGAETASRKWVKYEIQRSIDRGNGLLGVRIHHLKNQLGETDSAGAVPAGIPSGAVYKYEYGKIADWVEKAAIAAGKPCLAHQANPCWRCG